VAVGGQALAVATPRAEYADLFLPLHGGHQAENAATAIMAVEAVLEEELDADAVRASLSGATSPGRMEVVAREPLVILDGAHNPDAAGRLATALAEAFTWERLHLVLGVLREKDIDGMLGPLALLAHQGYAAASSSPRSRSAADTAQALERAGVPATTHASVEEALGAAREAAGSGDLILVTGSLYTVADARATKD
jgi:dihydrofolate synthase/folylpolyglutamate synthase